ncbi:hypothetical protein ONZ45_g6930 [Pleurotus djamor]|nr:hypothetical protein ONZ45_g6930 [Pleurotus djamor]
MGSVSTDLPPEVLDLVLNEVANPKRIDLYPFLFVCHRFHDLVIPILYEEISKELKFGGSWGFLSSLEASSHLAKIKRFSLISTILPDPKSTLPDIFASMTNLVKLSLEIPRPEPTVVTSIRLSTITHLSFNAYLTPYTFRHVLVALKSLTYLKIGYFPQDMEIPAHALPTLRSLSSDPIFWGFFATGRPVQHLESPITLVSTLYLRSQGFLHSIITLKLEVEDLRCFCEVIPHLQSVDIVLTEFKGIQFYASPQIDDYLAIPSQRLRYCNLGSLRISVEDSTRMFDNFPQLKAIDTSARVYRRPLAVLRYLRDAVSSPVTAHIPPLKRWEQWWENISQDLDG